MYAYRATIWYMYARNTFTNAGYFAAQKGWKPNALDVDLSGKTYVVTGANAGLGRATTEYLCKQGGTVHMLCRNKERGETARSEIVEKTGNDNVHLHIVDVSDLARVKEFCEEYVAEGHDLHSLICNAGVMLDERESTPEGFDKTYATNILGSTVVLTHHLLPALKRSSPSRVVLVSSGGMYTQKLDPKDMQFKGMKKWDGTVAYAQTKRAQVYLGHEWAKQYKDDGITFASMHPGWAETPGVARSMPGFAKKMDGKLRTSEQGADTIMWLAAAEDETIAENNGAFWFDRTVAREHLSMACTTSPDSDVEQMMKQLYEDAKISDTPWSS